jgi:hypothetical protein
VAEVFLIHTGDRQVFVDRGLADFDEHPAALLKLRVLHLLAWPSLEPLGDELR